MSGTGVIVLHSFETQFDAEMAKSALESAGIYSTISADSAGGMRPHLVWASGGFKLLIRAEDEIAARQAIEVPGLPD